MEWFAAFGLVVTLVWLYLEMLRLLSKLNAADARGRQRQQLELQEAQQRFVERCRGFLLRPVAHAIEDRCAAEVGQQVLHPFEPVGSITLTTSWCRR